MPRVARLIAGLPELIAAALAGFCLPLMILVLLGHFTVAWALPLGLAGALGAGLASGMSGAAVSPTTALCSLGAVMLAIAWFAYNVRYTAQDVFATRDPATYTITGRWLVDHASLDMHVRPDVFGSPPGAILSSGSFFNVSSDVVNAQGNHLLPAILALVGSLFGTGALLKTNVALGALALVVFFGLARRVVNPPLALLATATLAVSMPFVYVSRDSFTEPLTMLFLMGSLALIHRAFASGRLVDFALAGLTGGSAAMVRIDSYAALAGLIVAAAALVVIAPPVRRRRAVAQVAALLLGGAATSLMGWLDLVRLSRRYYHDQHRNIVMLFLGLVLALLLALIAVWTAVRPKVRTWLASDATRRRLVIGAHTTLVALFLIFASRPLWMTTRGGWNLDLENMQRRWRASVDGTRSYNEQTVNWLALYLGWPTVLLAVIGYAVLITEFVRRRAYALSALLAMGLVLSTLYLWNSQITPDQPWAMRRYVPVVIPALLVAAVTALHSMWRVRRLQAVVRPVVVMASAVLVAFPIWVSWPMRHVREEVPQLRQLQSLCAAIGPHGAVVLIDDAMIFGYGQSIRSFCNVPAIGFLSPTAADVSAMNESVIAHGQTLFMLSEDRQSLEIATGVSAVTFSAVQVQRWPNQINVAPDVPDSQHYTVFLATFDRAGHAHPVPPVTSGS